MQNLKQAHKARKMAFRQQRLLDNEPSTIFRTQQQPHSVGHYEQEMDFDESGEDFFAKLSDELVLQIFRRLPVAMLTRYSIVCKRWHRLMQDSSLWKRFDLSNGVVMSDLLIKFLNRGVKMLGLSRSEIRKSGKKRLNGGMIKTVSDQLEFHLSNVILVEYIDLTNCTIDVNAINSLLKHTRFLRKLSLEGLTINSDTLKFLAQNENMETLNLSLCVGVDKEGLLHLSHSLRKLSELNLSWTQLNKEEVSFVCQCLPSSLVELDLSGCKTTLLDSDVLSLVQSCPNLIELDLSDAQCLTELSVEHIAGHLSKLVLVGLSRCYKISPTGFFGLSKLDGLQVLNAFNVLKVASFQHLRKYIPSLIYLNQFPFSAIARPIVGHRSKRIWGVTLNEKPVVVKT